METEKLILILENLADDEETEMRLLVQRLVFINRGIKWKEPFMKRTAIAFRFKRKCANI